MAYSSLRSIEGPSKSRKPKKARRTPTEIGQTTPSTPTGEKGKAVVVRATSKSGKKVRRATAKYQRQLEAEQEVAAVKGLTRTLRKQRKLATHPRFAERAAERLEKRILRESIKPMTTGSVVAREARKTAGQGVIGRTVPKLGIADKKTARKVANVGREIALGSRDPNVGELIIAGAPVPAAKVASTVRAGLRGAKGLKTAEKVARTTKAAKAARKGRKGKTAAAKAKAKTKPAKVKATAKGMGKEAKARLNKVERQARRAKRQDRALRAATSPVGAAALAAPGDIGERARAFVEGTTKANIPKSVGTTLEGIPGLFSAGASVAGGAYRSAKTGNPDYLTEAAKTMGEGAVDILEPYVSGDPERVREATEETGGYILAPLAPRGSVSAPSRFVGRQVKGGAKVVARPATKRIAARRRASGKTSPGKVQRAGQVVAGGKKRKDVAVTMQRHRGPELRKGQEDAAAIEAVARKAKGARGLKNFHGPDAGAAAAILARHGIGRKNTLARLKEVVDQTDNPRNEMVNLTNTAEWLRRNPKALKDDRFWETVAEFKPVTDPLVTSRRAQFAAQGDIAGVTRPEHAVPIKARAFTKARTREGAFKDLEKSKHVLAKTKYDARVARLQAAEATGPRRRELAEVAATLREVARKQEIKVRGLSATLKDFRAKNTWDKALEDEYVDKVRTERNADLEDPAWLSEKPIKQDPDVPGGGNKPGLVMHTQTGGARKADAIDRSLPAVLRNSVVDPRLRRGTARGIREVLHRHKQTVGGRSVFTGPELVRLHTEGKIDLTKSKAIPSRWWKAPMDDEIFDAAKLHDDTAALLRTELSDLRNAKGTKYVVAPNEVAFELVDQLAPEAGRWEKVVGTTAGIGSRVVLYSPAWAAAQVVNEGSQLLADAGARGTAGAVADLVNMRIKDPKGYRAILRQTGDPSPAAHPVVPRVNASAAEYLDISDAARALRKTPVGRFLYEAAHLRTFSNIDRWKTTRIRAIALLAKNNREFGQFTKGLGKTMKGMEEISGKLAKMSRKERHKWIASNPAVLRHQLDHVDDMLGNWDAFTRFERTYGPLASFYGYLRMSLRWTFKTFPKKHPIKAQILYVLAQQNRDQLEKLLGSEPSFIQSAYPVLYNEEGEADAVMPGGARFGAPGSNVVVEAIGEGNVIGAYRLLNPTLSTGFFATTGLSPFTGEQEAKPGTGEWGLNALSTLLSTAPPLRATGLNELEEESDASKVFDAIDPKRALRSALNPFQPLSGERARMQQTLSDALEAASNDPEYGDLVDAILDEDKPRVRELAKRVDLADEAKEVIEQFLPSSKAEEKAVSEAGAIIGEGTKALKGKKSQPSSTSTASSGSGGGGAWWENGGGGGGSPAPSTGGSSSSGGKAWWE